MICPHMSNHDEYKYSGHDRRKSAQTHSEWKRVLSHLVGADVQTWLKTPPRFAYAALTGHRHREYIPIAGIITNRMYLASAAVFLYKIRHSLTVTFHLTRLNKIQSNDLSITCGSKSPKYQQLYTLFMYDPSDIYV